MTDYAKVREVKAGDTLIADGGFTCIRNGATLDVKADEDGHLFVPCREGRHYLAGQVDDNAAYIGLSKAPVQ